MNAARWNRAAGLALVVIAGATAQGCELRPSRQFVPPTNLSAGPPVRAFTPAAAQDELDPEPPAPPPAERDDGVREQVVVRRLQNGMTLHALPRSDVPAATILIVFGTKRIPSSSATAHLYASAAAHGRANPWARRQLDGAGMFTVSRPDFVAIGITSLSSVIEPVVSRLVLDMVSALLWKWDVDAAKEEMVIGLADFQPARRGYTTALAGLFPVPHPYGSGATAQIPERVREVKVAEVHAFRDANLTTDNMMVTATGHVDVDSLVTTLDRALASVPRTSSARVTHPEPRPSCARQVIAINDVGSQQTTVTVAYPAVPALHADVAALEVLAAAAGGSIATHLNASLRRGRGLSYGFGAKLRKMREGGVFSVEGDVDPARTVEALGALNDEIDALRRAPLGDDDLRVAKISAGHATSRLGGAITAVRLAEASILGIPMSDGSAINAVTAEQVRAAAERYLLPAKRCIVAVGDAPRIERELQSAGLGPVSRGQ